MNLKNSLFIASFHALIILILSLKSAVSFAEFDAALKQRLTEELHSGTPGIRLSQIYQEALVKKFSHLPVTSQLLQDNSCIIFAVGSVGRHEAIYGSDLEAGIFCTHPLEPSTVRTLQGSLEKDVPQLIWDSEFTVFENYFSEATLRDDLKRVPSSSLLKLLDASPIAYIHCSPETFSFSKFRTLVLQHVFTDKTFADLDKTQDRFLKGDFNDLKSELEEVQPAESAQTTESPQALSLSQLTDLDDENLNRIFFHTPFTGPKSTGKLIQLINLKQTIYRIITHVATIRYLKLCKLGVLGCGVDSWKITTHERLQEIVSTAPDSLFSAFMTETMDTFLALRMGAMLRSNHNYIDGSDIHLSKDQSLLFFNSIPQSKVLNLIVQVLSLSKNEALIAEPPLPIRFND